MLTLEGELSIHEAALQRDRLLAWLDRGADGGLDLTAVTECDSAGVQLLVALRKTLEARGQHLQLHAPPACVRAALRDWGLDLDDRPATPGEEIA